jgi:hypothetical protein
MREKKSLDFSAARATTPSRFQVVALHWKAAVEGGTAHLTILRYMSLVRFEWTPLFFTNRAFHRSFLEKSGIFRCHAINFNTTMSPRQEVKDGHSLHRSIHSYGRFDRFQMCGFTADGAFLTPWTMPPQVTF